MNEYDKELLEVLGGGKIFTMGTTTQRAIREIVSQSTESLQSGLLERIRESNISGCLIDNASSACDRRNIYVSYLVH